MKTERTSKIRFNISKSILEKDIMYTQNKKHLTKKSDNMICNRIASKNKTNIKYDNVIINGGGVKKYIGDYYRSVVLFLLQTLYKVVT